MVFGGLCGGGVGGVGGGGGVRDGGVAGVTLCVYYNSREHS